MYCLRAAIHYVFYWPDGPFKSLGSNISPKNFNIPNKCECGTLNIFDGNLSGRKDLKGLFNQQKA